MHLKEVIIILCMILGISNASGQSAVRQNISLNEGWRSIADEKNNAALDGFQASSFNDKSWLQVEVPHNWDAYEGYRRMRHGNRHGYAWYRKTFSISDQKPGKRFFLFFEGVGSYATVWLNGKMVGSHAGGRTTFTLDVTDVIKRTHQPNLLAVLAGHPANITDLPWVCGGCSDERGFSEGSQPMGIFRPVHLVITDAVRIEPFGVHAWNDTTVTKGSAQLFLETEVKNYSAVAKKIIVQSRLLDKTGSAVVTTKSVVDVAAGSVSVSKQLPPVITNPHLWSLEDPYLYSLVSEIIEDGKVIDRVITPYGIRWISWPVGKSPSSNQFYLNVKPVFINGIAEYEHLIGKSHAFSAEQINTRVKQIKAAGFNAFRDAHQPHNLRYQDQWDSLGLLWWTQMSAHAWYDSPAFRTNFKKLLVEWVKERRNNPSLVLWGLQNESKLPEDFARECTALIRQLDPTASSQRLVTTCNGGTGTDWDVPQNWTGTYGGDPKTYREDLKRQVLVGEYGAWRTLDLHSEGPFVQNAAYSEERMTQLMETKLRLGEAAKDSTAGHFMWLLTSHDNPGRVQGGEGYRELDRIGPVNYKGLLTPWEEPLDVFYMFRSNYAPKLKEPMVYIVSHTWPDRWITTGKKDSLVVYSNCDEVELFNDMRSASLGKRKRQGLGTHFQWDGVLINYNVLFAVGYVNGKEVAKDYIVLNHLPKAPHFDRLLEGAKPVTAPQKSYHYIYRVNCGGGDYVDKNLNKWLADREKTAGQSWGSVSWTKDFAGMPAFFASQRAITDPIHGTEDWKLFQTFRYGREKLQYEFHLPDGEYLVELYFTEPWFGTGGGMDCKGWRLFDVAFNGKTALSDVDIWKESGHAAALKKIIKTMVRGGRLVVSFPRVASGQAVISAIAIATLDTKIKPAEASPALIKNLSGAGSLEVRNWLKTGDEQYVNERTTFSGLPPVLYGAEWIKMPKEIHGNDQTPLAQFDLHADADVFVALPEIASGLPGWLKAFEDTKFNVSNDLKGGQQFRVFRKRFLKDARVTLPNQPGNQIGMIAVLPISSIEPAYDLKPVASYKAVNATLAGAGLKKGLVDGKDRAIFSKASADNMLEWNMSIGAADTYSLTISYNNPKAETMKGKLLLLSADGTLMKEENVLFTKTPPGKSNYINSSTGTMINAGNYKVRLMADGEEGLSVNSLEVQ